MALPDPSPPGHDAETLAAWQGASAPEADRLTSGTSPFDDAGLTAIGAQVREFAQSPIPGRRGL